jgi:CheY-like chemotaxis protein
VSPDARHPLVLLVDDEARDLAEMADLLRRHGFRVEAAGTFDEAIAALGMWSFAAVVSDLRLDRKPPGPGGLELLQAVTTAQPEALRVLVTAYADGPDIAQALSAVFVDKEGDARIMLVEVLRRGLRKV